MKRIKCISIITTVINGIMSVLAVVIAISCALLIGNVGRFAGENLDKLSEVDENSLTAGYERLGHLGGGFLGITGTVILFAAIFLCVLAALYFLVPSVFGIVINASAKKKTEDVLAFSKGYKTDALIKIIFNGIPLVFMILGTFVNIKDILGNLVWIIFWGVLTGLSVFQLVEAKKYRDSN